MKHSTKYYFDIVDEYGKIFQSKDYNTLQELQYDLDNARFLGEGVAIGIFSITDDNFIEQIAEKEIKNELKP